jgi:hypothetical protein
MSIPNKLPRRYHRYRDEDRKPKLADTFVLLLDILGTKATTTEEALRNLEVTENALSRANDWASTSDEWSVVKWFSDNLALADPVELEGPEDLAFGFHLITASSVQFALAEMGLFSRGGMTRGAFYADEMFVYGPALVEAYELESKQALTPRTILSTDLANFALEDLRRLQGGSLEVHRKLLAVDRDGIVFVNYLDGVFDEPAETWDSLVAHKQTIEERLTEHQGNPHVHQKYQWLADYHDRFCRARFPRDAREEVIIGTVDGSDLVPFGAEVPIPPLPPNIGKGGIEF